MCIVTCRAGSGGLARGFLAAAGVATARRRLHHCVASVAGAMLIACGSDPGEPGDSGLALSTTTHDFGSMAVGGQSPVLTITVSNTGTTRTGALSVAFAGPTSADFALARDDCSGLQLSGGATCVIEVEVVPSQLGLRQATLTVSEPGGERVTATLSGTGSTSGLSLSPTVVTFGETGIGQNGGTKTLVVRNTAFLATGAITVAMSGGGAAAFTITRDICSTTSLERGASCAIDVRFVPATGGSHSATLTVAGVTAPGRSVQLLGLAAEATTLTATPGSYSFPAQEVGFSGSEVTFVIANTGTRPTGALVVEVAGANRSDFQVAVIGCYPTLAAGATCSVGVTFAPSVAGMRAASVTLSDPIGSNVTINVTGEALPAPPPPTVLTLNPRGSFAFPPTLIGAPVTQVVTVTNPASVATGPLSTSVLACDDYYYWGCYPSPGFSLWTDTCDNVSLPAGGSCTVAITFTPSFVGIETAQFDVSAPGFTATLGLSGTGTGLHPSLGEVTFPPTVVGSTSASQTVVITNNGPGPTGTLASEISGFVFEIVSNTCAGASLPAGGFCTIAVRFKPTATGGRYGSLGVTATPGGTIHVQVFGVGL